MHPLNLPISSAYYCHVCRVDGLRLWRKLYTTDALICQTCLLDQLREKFQGRESLLAKIVGGQLIGSIHLTKNGFIPAIPRSDLFQREFSGKAGWEFPLDTDGNYQFHLFNEVLKRRWLTLPLFD